MPIWLVLISIVLSLFLNIESISLSRRNSEVKSLMNIIQKIYREDEYKVLLNKQIFEQNDLITSVVEYPIKNAKNNYEKLDKNMIVLTNLYEGKTIKSEQLSNGINSKSLRIENNQQTDILIKFKSETILLNQIYKISLLNKNTNVIDFKLKLNAKKNRAFALNSKSKFTEIFFVESEKTIKIKSNMMEFPFYDLYEKQINKDLDILNRKPIQYDEGDFYYLNSLIISDIVTKNDAPWSNLMFQIQICPSMYAFVK
jgi:hypothetical protein